MRIPGTRRSNAPDRCGFSAGRFAEAVRHGDMAVAWNLLSKESRGVRQGVWATEKDVDLQVVYRAAMDPNHPMYQPMLRDFREAVLKYWPLEDLSDLGVAPTSYVDDFHAFAFLPMGMDDDQEINGPACSEVGANHTYAAGGRSMEGQPPWLAVGLEIGDLPPGSNFPSKAQILNLGDNMAEYKLVSSDSHVVEPPDLWQRYIDPRYSARAPRIVREGAYDQWYADGDVKFGIVGSDTQAGRRFDAPETIQIDGSYENVRQGGFDPHAHVSDMDMDGVSGDVCTRPLGWRHA